MFGNFGLLEPNYELQIAYFGCVIVLYFVPFFNKHPVVAYSDKMLFLDLGPGTSDLGSLI